VGFLLGVLLVARGAWAAPAAEPLDWTKLMGGAAPVVLVGDVHDFKAIKEELAAHAADFRAAGITHIGFEMFGEDHRAALAGFCERGDADGSIRSDLGSWGWTPDELESLLAAACAAGLRPVPLDYSYDEQARLKESFADIRAARDDRMAANVVELLKENPGARLLVFAGEYHVWPGQLPARLRARGLATVSMQFVVDREESYNGSAAFGWVEQLRSAGLADSRLAIPAGPAERLRVCDVFVLVPRVLEESPEAERNRASSGRFHR
jgi:hypothetical protein